MSCFLIPLCDASQNRCVGVLECYAHDIDSFLQHGQPMLICLEIFGLSLFNVQKDLLYKAIGDLEKTEDEIRAALKMACKLHTLTFAQVSIASEDKNLVKQMVALTMITNLINDDDADYDYITYCDMLPVKIMDGLAGKALKNYEPHSCKNIMGNIEQPATITMQKYSCLVICLRSSLTGDHVDYVFEFLWTPEELCYRTMIKRLILTLMGCLPNFKFACGAEFGDELHVIDVGNFSKRGIQTTLIFFKGEKLSPIPTVNGEGSKRKDEKGKTHGISLTIDQLEQQCRKPLEEAATNLNVSKSTLKRKWKGLNRGRWPGPKGGKRKANNLYKDQSNMNEGDNTVILEPLAETFTIEAEYQNDWIKLRLPVSSVTFEAVEKKISKKLKLESGSFKLKYRDENEKLFLFVDDEDLKDCIEILRSGNNTAIKLFVEQSV